MRLCSIDVGVRNLAFVVIDVPETAGPVTAGPVTAGPVTAGTVTAGTVTAGTVTVRSWVSASTVPATTCVRGMCKTDAVEAVVRALEERAELLECDTVLVEMQPRFAPLNAQTAHAIVAYFVVRKRVDLDEPVAVHLVHAGKKNAWTRDARSAGGPPGRAGPVGRAAKYARNKSDSVEACARVVERGNCAKLARAWAAFKKKDDAADALVQALAWLGVPRDSARAVAAVSM